jgi:hypothetical protein
MVARLEQGIRIKENRTKHVYYLVRCVFSDYEYSILRLLRFLLLMFTLE